MESRKLRTIHNKLTAFGERLTEEYQNLDQQPYGKFAKHSNRLLLGSVLYLIQFLLVGIMAVYGADQFVTATESWWLVGIISIYVILFKTTVIIVAWLSSWYAITYPIYGQNILESKKKGSDE